MQDDGGIGGQCTRECVWLMAMEKKVPNSQKLCYFVWI